MAFILVNVVDLVTTAIIMSLSTRSDANPSPPLRALLSAATPFRSRNKRQTTVAYNKKDGDWDLVNMQRLSKAVEDTGSSTTSAAVDPTVPDNTPASAETPASAAAAATAAAISRPYAPGQAWTPPAKTDDISAEADAAEADGGFEESKSCDEEGVGDNTGTAAVVQEEVNAQVPAQAATPPPSSSVPQAMSTKWHRELCSLAEMGFENAARNVQLLEKHVVESGSPGMERCVHVVFCALCALDISSFSARSAVLVCTLLWNFSTRGGCVVQPSSRRGASSVVSFFYLGPISLMFMAAFLF